MCRGHAHASGAHGFRLEIAQLGQQAVKAEFLPLLHHVLVVVGGRTEEVRARRALDQLVAVHDPRNHFAQPRVEPHVEIRALDGQDALFLVLQHVQRFHIGNERRFDFGLARKPHLRAGDLVPGLYPFAVERLGNSDVQIRFAGRGNLTGQRHGLLAHGRSGDQAR